MTGVVMNPFTLDFRFIYIVDSGERTRTIALSKRDDGRAFTDIADEAFEAAYSLAEERHPGCDVEMWSE